MHERANIGAWDLLICRSNLFSFCNCYVGEEASDPGTLHRPFPSTNPHPISPIWVSRSPDSSVQRLLSKSQYRKIQVSPYFPSFLIASTRFHPILALLIPTATTPTVNKSINRALFFSLLTSDMHISPSRTSFLRAWCALVF